MKVIVLNFDNYLENKIFCKWLKKLGYVDAFRILEGDPDYLMLNGEKILFDANEINGDRYVLYLSESGENMEAENILSSFFSDNFEKKFTKLESLWENFGEKCIAYRGGEGCIYSIWKFN